MRVSMRITGWWTLAFWADVKATHLIPYLMGNCKRDGGSSRGTFTAADRWLTCDRWKMMYLYTGLYTKSICGIVTLWCSWIEDSCQGGCRGGGITGPFQCCSTLWSWLLREQPLGPWAVRGTSQGLIQLAHLAVSESCKEGWHILLHGFFHVFFGSSVSPFTVVITCES